MKKIKFAPLILILSLIQLNNFLFAAIVDTPEATLSPAQREWLIDNQVLAKELYISEIAKAIDKEVPAYNVAFISYSKKDFQETDKYLNLALNSNPKYGPALLLKARIEYDRKNLTNCFKHLKKAIKYHPFPEIPNYYYGKYLYERNKYDDAIDYLKEAISDNKLYTFSYPILGDIYLRHGEFDDAIKILEKGLKYSYDAEILYQLARAYKISGQKNRSIKYFGLFSYLYPLHPNTGKVTDYLAENNVKNIFTNGFEPIPERGESSRFFTVGEDVLYSVHWGIIRVGELNTEIVDTLIYKGHEAYKVRFSLDSNPVLKFIASLHSDYFSIIDQRTKQTYCHYLHIRENNITVEKVYDFDRINGIFKCRIIREDGHIDYLEKYLPRNTIDGNSVLFYSRQVVKERRTELVLTTIDETFVITEISFNNVKDPIMVRGKEELAFRINGENRYKGIVGFTGKFRGWFRDDPSYTPVGSDFEIWIGRISIKMATVEEQQLHKYAR